MDVQKTWDKVENEEDVAQKRYLMFRLFEQLLDERYTTLDEEPGLLDRIKHLKALDGYMYKLSQDFLTSSSTLDKQNKLEKIIEHVKRKKD